MSRYKRKKGWPRSWARGPDAPPVRAERWMVKWRSTDDSIDGAHVFLRGGVDMTFKTRRACVEWIKAHYGYLSKRSDLSGPPHGWRMPVPVRVSIIIREIIR